MTIARSALVISVTALTFILEGCTQVPAGLAQGTAGILGGLVPGAQNGPQTTVSDSTLGSNLIAQLAPQDTGVRLPPGNPTANGTIGTAPGSPRPIPTVEENLFVPSVGRLTASAVGNVGVQGTAQVNGEAPSMPRPIPTVEENLYVPAANARASISPIQEQLDEQALLRQPTTIATNPGMPGLMTPQ